MPKTTHTPTGQYPESAPFHSLDLEDECDRLLEKLIAAGGTRQSQNLAREAGVSLVLLAIEGGDTIREHATPGATTVQVARGHVTLTTEGQTIDLRPGQTILFQPAIRHDLHAEEQSAVLLTISGGEH